LWRGWKNRMTTQNRQKSNAKKDKTKQYWVKQDQTRKDSSYITKKVPLKILRFKKFNIKSTIKCSVFFIPVCTQKEQIFLLDAIYVITWRMKLDSTGCFTMMIWWYGRIAESMKYVCTLLVLRTMYMMVLGILFNSSGELGEIIYLQSRKYPTQESMQISCSLFER